MAKPTELLKQMKTLAEIASQDTETWDIRTKAGVDASKRAAADDLFKVQKQYAEYVKEAAVGLVLKGGNQDEFAKLAATETDTVTVDASALYNRLADAIEPTITARKEFGTENMVTFLRELSMISKELTIQSIATPLLADGTQPVPNRKALVALVASLVRQSVGIDLNRIYLRDQMFKAAVAANASKPVLAVVVKNASEIECNDLALYLVANGIVVDVPADVTKDVVLKSFNQLKKKLTKK